LRPGAINRAPTLKHMEWTKGKYTISTDKDRLDIPMIHRYLSTNTYWASERPLDVVERSIANSLCFGIYNGTEQIGFARVVTDYATFGWIADVFVLEPHRGNGLSKWLMDIIITHPELQGFRRWVLATKDAHELYRKYGFNELKRPERFMERFDPATREKSDYWKKD
jgi:GNAT superfamily N-acetyltransferase